MLLVAFAGLAGSGKSTAAMAAGVLPGVWTRRIGFADPIKYMLTAAGLADPLRMTQEPSYKDLPCPVSGVTPRRMMQTLGTEWGRETIDPAIWIKLAMREVDKSCDYDAVIIDDLRFENEATAVRERGGIVAHVIRDGIEQGDHASESGVVQRAGDHVLFNDGTEYEWESLVQSWFEGVLWTHKSL